MAAIWHRLTERLPQGYGLVVGFILIILLSVWSAAASGYYFLAGIPVLVIGAYLAIVDFRPIYWLLLMMIPISTEVALPGGFGTDLPTEPLIVTLMLIFGFFLLRHQRQLSTDILRHPVTLVLLLHLAWTLVTTITSDLPFVSIKFLLAKIWYIVTFFLLTAYLIRDEADFRRLFWIFFWPFMLMVTVIVLRHALLGFSFMGIHSIMHPFQRNHVNYAASLALFFPYVIAIWTTSKRWSFQWLLLAGTAAFLLIAIYFSYTRAAYIALIIAAGTFLLIRWRLIRYALLAAVIGGVIAVAFMVKDSRYLDYAPDFDRTVSHERFDNLIEATYKMEDISTMERVYRWVAAGHMAPERPILGWGPGNFVNFYKPFTVSSFETYVSDNPEQSGVHSYFFMVLVEQGLPGLLIFIALLAVFYIRGEQLYHALRPYPDRQLIVIVALLST
ncbi:MAG: O-antigen ligase family protein, partial [Bacteroidota bacterium]